MLLPVILICLFSRVIDEEQFSYTCSSASFTPVSVGFVVNNVTRRWEQQPKPTSVLGITVGDAQAAPLCTAACQGQEKCKPVNPPSVRLLQHPAAGVSAGCWGWLPHGEDSSRPECWGHAD